MPDSYSRLHLRPRHPWRAPVIGAPSVDPVANTRSPKFAAYLETLPREERRKIETAERAFVAKAKSANSRQQATSQDFADSMLGINADGRDAADNRGFG